MPALATRMSIRLPAGQRALHGGLDRLGSVTEARVGHRLAARGADHLDRLLGRLRSVPASPDSETPRSLTTTLAPRAASARACERPKPRACAGDDGHAAVKAHLRHPGQPPSVAA